jgi:hypothetical protein
MAGRGKCPHINSISDFNQADVQRAKEVSIVTNQFYDTVLFQNSVMRLFGYRNVAVCL